MLKGEHIFQRARVLIISLEDDREELRRRIEAVLRYYGISRAELKGWLFLSAPGRKAGKLLTVDNDGVLVPGDFARKIEAQIIKHHIDLVGLDPFVKAHAVEENQNTQMDQVAQILTDLADKYDIAIDAPHHTSKGAADPGNADRGRGASATKDAMRLVYTLTAMSKEDADALGVKEEERITLVRMDNGKVNLVPKAASARWYKLIGVPIDNGTELYPNGDTIQVATSWTPPELFDGVMDGTINSALDDIDKGLDGKPYSMAGAARTRAVWKVIHKHMPDKTKEQCQEIAKTWLRSGLLTDEEFYDEDRREPAKGVRVDNTKRPGTIS